MAVTPQRDDHAQHRQPEEQEVGEFVGPEQRTVEHVARHYAGEQDAHLGQHKQCANELAGFADGLVEQEGASPQHGPAGRDRLGKPRCEVGRVEAHAVSGPTYFSSSAQALSPAVFFISG